MAGAEDGSSRSNNPFGTFRGSKFNWPASTQRMLELLGPRPRSSSQEPCFKQPPRSSFRLLPKLKTEGCFSFTRGSKQTLRKATPGEVTISTQPGSLNSVVLGATTGDVASKTAQLLRRCISTHILLGPTGQQVRKKFDAKSIVLLLCRWYDYRYSRCHLLHSLLPRICSIVSSRASALLLKAVAPPSSK